MVEKLECLEKVEWWGGLSLERVHVLSRLRNLKTLKWVIPKDRYVKGKESTRELGVAVSEILRKRGLNVEVKVEIKPWRLKDGNLIREMVNLEEVQPTRRDVTAEDGSIGPK
jgi:hypothetical protein